MSTWPLVAISSEGPLALLSLGHRAGPQVLLILGSSSFATDRERKRMAESSFEQDTERISVLEGFGMCDRTGKLSHRVGEQGP